MKDHSIGDAPIEKQYANAMRSLARVLDETFNHGLKGEARKVGFCLMIFKFGEGGRANYISNANRDDVVALLKEQLARFEGQAEQKGEA
jgi:hypothetical protein